MPRFEATGCLLSLHAHQDPCIRPSSPTARQRIDRPLSRTQAKDPLDPPPKLRPQLRRTRNQTISTHRHKTRECLMLAPCLEGKAVHIPREPTPQAAHTVKKPENPQTTATKSETSAAPTPRQPPPPPPSTANQQQGGGGHGIGRPHHGGAPVTSRPRHASTTLPSFCTRLSSKSPCLMHAWYCAFLVSGRFVSTTPPT